MATRRFGYVLSRLSIKACSIQCQRSFMQETTMHKCNKQEQLCQSTFLSGTQRQLVLEDYHFQTQMAFITQRERTWCIAPGARHLVLHRFPKKDDTQSKQLKVILHGLLWSMAVALNDVYFFWNLLNSSTSGPHFRQTQLLRRC